MNPKINKSLVVVESPAKARTISRILGSDYDVKASLGHVRDLPKREIGVDVDAGFEPKYIVPREKSKTVRAIREAAQEADQVFLATDPDREGEAIAWHLLEGAGLRELPHHRVVFHEITAEAVQQAFRHPREIDMKLVEAQQARRVIDRLVGYRLSPFLWVKVRRGLSAGRVQSVAVRLVVEREREIERFVRQEYWTIEAELEKQDVRPAFKAKLSGYVHSRKKLAIPSEADAQAIVAALRSSLYGVKGVQTKVQARRPSAPFITSTLQQEASRRLGFSTRRTMHVAQDLYEGIALGSEREVGLITYMRTDSTHVAPSAQQDARQYITLRFGAQFVPAHPREYRKKVKGAQEAHEAIRPTSIHREPESIRRYLSPEQHRLYNLIWQRMVASQMSDALFDVTSADIETRAEAGGESYLLRASNTQLRFPGFRKVYVEGRDDGEEEDTGSNPLPELTAGDALRLLGLNPEQHFTEPPARYTEATLVKALEEKGIGRPSTYAPTMSIIQDRGYVDKDGRYLKPAGLGVVVNDLLVDHFPEIVDVGFTAQMESELDEVAGGERKWRPVVQEVYKPLVEKLEAASREAPKQMEETEEACPECGKPMIIRWGRRGRFVACTGFPKCHYTRPVEGGEQEAPPEATDEKCPTCDAPMSIRSSRFGRFLACTRYPECKGKRQIVEKTGVKCPRDDGGELTGRRSRKGHNFWGCSNYPECDFTVWGRPLAQPCPKCGSMIIAAGRDEKVKCTNCTWRGEAPQESRAAATA